jgi:hypothetical protein
MTFEDWFSWYDETLAAAFARAFLDGAVEFEESFAQWCKAEYEIYRENPTQYEAPYTGLLD